MAEEPGGHGVTKSQTRLSDWYRFYWVRVGPISNNWCTYKKAHTEGRKACDVGCRDWSDVASSQRMPRMARNHYA